MQQPQRCNNHSASNTDEPQLDEDLRPWFLGFQGDSSLSSASPYHARIIGTMVKEIIPLVVDPLYPSDTPRPPEPERNFELLYSGRDGDVLDTEGNPLPVRPRSRRGPLPDAALLPAPIGWRKPVFQTVSGKKMGVGDEEGKAEYGILSDLRGRPTGPLSWWHDDLGLGEGELVGGADAAVGKVPVTPAPVPPFKDTVDRVDPLGARPVATPLDVARAEKGLPTSTRTGMRKRAFFDDASIVESEINTIGGSIGTLSVAPRSTATGPRQPKHRSHAPRRNPLEVRERPPSPSRLSRAACGVPLGPVSPRRARLQTTDVFDSPDAMSLGGPGSEFDVPPPPAEDVTLDGAGRRRPDSPTASFKIRQALVRPRVEHDPKPAWGSGIGKYVRNDPEFRSGSPTGRSRANGRSGSPTRSSSPTRGGDLGRRASGHSSVRGSVSGSLRGGTSTVRGAGSARGSTRSVSSRGTGASRSRSISPTRRTNGEAPRGRGTRRSPSPQGRRPVEHSSRSHGASGASRGTARGTARGAARGGAPRTGGPKPRTKGAGASQPVARDVRGPAATRKQHAAQAASTSAWAATGSEYGSAPILNGPPAPRTRKGLRGTGESPPPLMSEADRRGAGVVEASRVVLDRNERLLAERGIVRSAPGSAPGSAPVSAQTDDDLLADLARDAAAILDESGDGAYGGSAYNAAYGGSGAGGDGSDVILDSHTWPDRDSLLEVSAKDVVEEMLAKPLSASRAAGADSGSRSESAFKAIPSISSDGGGGADEIQSALAKLGSAREVWVEVADPSNPGESYFYHAVTREAVWERPSGHGVEVVPHSVLESAAARMTVA